MWNAVKKKGEGLSNLLGTLEADLLSRDFLGGGGDDAITTTTMASAALSPRSSSSNKRRGQWQSPVIGKGRTERVWILAISMGVIGWEWMPSSYAAGHFLPLIHIYTCIHTYRPSN